MMQGSPPSSTPCRAKACPPPTNAHTHHTKGSGQVQRRAPRQHSRWLWRAMHQGGMGARASFRLRHTTAWRGGQARVCACMTRANPSTTPAPHPSVPCSPVPGPAAPPPQPSTTPLRISPPTVLSPRSQPQIPDKRPLFPHQLGTWDGWQPLHQAGRREECVTRKSSPGGGGGYLGCVAHAALLDLSRLCCWLYAAARCLFTPGAAWGGYPCCMYIPAPPPPCCGGRGTPTPAWGCGGWAA